MNLGCIFDYVYINVSGSYENEYVRNIDLEHLLIEVAKANPNGDSKQLYDSLTGTVYMGRTKRFVVRKVKCFICDLQEKETPEVNMATFASIKQLEKLTRVSIAKNKSISCYGLLFLYIIYTLLPVESMAAEKCLDYIEWLDDLVYAYFENNPDNLLAEFFHGCRKPIVKAINTHNRLLNKTDLPLRHRKKPRDIDI